MSVNLLPDQSRKRDEDEMKKNAFENKKPVFSYSDPAKKENKFEAKKENFWGEVKDEFGDLIGQFKPKSKENLVNKPGNLNLTKNENQNKKNEAKDLLTDIGLNSKTNNISGIQKKENSQTDKKQEFKIESLEEKKEEKKQEARQPLPKDFPEGRFAKTGTFEINLVPETIKEEEEYKKKRRNYFVIVAVLILFLTLIYSIFAGVVAQKRSKIKNIENSIMNVSAEIEQMEKNNEKINEFSKNMKVVKEVLDNHIFTSRAFEFLEKNTLKEVYYSEAQIDAIKNTLSLVAYAGNYATLSKQVLYWQGLEEVELVEVSGVEAVEGGGEDEEENLGVSFNINLHLTEKFYLSNGN